MATYKISAARYLRMFTAEKPTPAYAANTDAENIVDRLCDVPWKKVGVKDATMTSHSTEIEERQEIKKSGLDWNVDDRSYFDAAVWCAGHSGGNHRAYANAACYVFALPDMASYPNVTSLKVKVTSDPYNVSGVRLAVKTSDTLVIPTSCSECRTGDFHAEGAVPHTVVTDAKGNVSWYAKTQDVTLAPASGSTVALKKYLFLFVLKENYAETRANWLEGSSFIKNNVEITTSASITGWTDGGTYDCSFDASDSVEFVVCRDGVVPDADGETSGVISVNLLASGTDPVRDAGNIVKNIAQVDDELKNENYDTGLVSSYGRLSNGSVPVGAPAVCSPENKRLGVGFRFGSHHDVVVRDAFDVTRKPNVVSMTASSFSIPFSLPTNRDVGKIRFDWASWLQRSREISKMINISKEVSDLRSVAYGNGRFVAVSYSGYTYFLKNGSSTWNELSYSSNSFVCVAYGGGRFVAVGTAGASCALADNATAWTALSGAAGNIRSVAYGNGRFVTVGENGASYALADNATTWTSLSGGAGLESIAYGGGRFVAVGTAGASCALADNATSWSSLSGSSGSLVSVAYGNGRFVCVGGSGASYALAGNATTWTSLSGISSNLRCIAFGGGMFVAGGEGGMSFSMNASASEWSSNASYKFDLNAVSFGGGRFVFVCSNGNSCSYKHETSSWNSMETTLYGSFTSVAYGGGRFMATCSSGICSSDGNSGWTLISGVSVRKIAYGNGRFVAVGNGGSAYSISDGSNSVVSIPIGNREDYRDVAYGSGRFVAVGLSYGNTVSDESMRTYILEDGSDQWVQASTSDMTLCSNVIGYGGGRFVASGFLYGKMCALYDGSNSLVELQNVNFAGKSITYAQNRFLLIGGKHVYLFNDGASNIAEISNAGGNLVGASYGNGCLVAVGSNGASYRMQDGSTEWNEVFGLSGNFNSVAFGNGRFVAVGENGISGYSSNFVSFSDLSFSKSSESLEDGYGVMSLVVYSEGKFLAFGNDSYYYSESFSIGESEGSWSVSANTGSDVSFAVHGDGRLVAVGSGVSWVMNDENSSWVEIALPDDMIRAAGVAYGNGRFVAVGSKTLAACVMPSGATAWTALPVVSGNLILNSVAYGGGRFVAVGNNVSYSLADDATTWTALSAISSSNNFIAYGGGRFVAVGDNGVSYALADGSTTWTTLTGASGNVNSVSYGKGRFVAVCGNGAVYSLGDGETAWELVTTVDGHLESVSCGNGRFVIVGYADVDESHTRRIAFNMFEMGHSLKFNFWLKDGFSNAIDASFVTNPNAYYAIGDVGDHRLLGVVDAEAGHAEFDISNVTSKACTAVVTAFVRPEDVKVDPKSFSEGTPLLFMNTMSAGEDVRKNGVVKRMYGSENLMIPDISLLS